MTPHTTSAHAGPARGTARYPELHGADGPARAGRLLALLLGTMMLAGCVSTIRDTGTLAGGYENFNAVDERTVKVRLFDDGAAAGGAAEVSPTGNDAGTASNDGRPLLFIVPEPEWKAGADPWPDEPERLEDLLFTVRERLYRYLLREYPHPARVRYAWQESDPRLRGYRVLTVHAAITDYKQGNGFLRYVVGWGAGQTRFQLEGRIVEGHGAGRRLLGEYVVRRGHAGYAQNGLNPAVLRSDYALRYAAEEAIGLLTAELAVVLPPGDVPAEPEDRGTRGSPAPEIATQSAAE